MLVARAELALPLLIAVDMMLRPQSGGTFLQAARGWLLFAAVAAAQLAGAIAPPLGGSACRNAAVCVAPGPGNTWGGGGGPPPPPRGGGGPNRRWRRGAGPPKPGGGGPPPPPHTVIPAASYSPGRLPSEYHRRWRA